MRALFYSPGRGLEWGDAPVPAVEEPTDAIVRPLAASIGDFDRLLFSGQLLIAETPFPVGRDAVGEVVEVGSAVTAVQPGDTVVVCNHISCGACERCTGGRPEHCHVTATLTGPGTFGIPGDERFGGLFAELVRVPFADSTLVGVPEGVDAIDAIATGDDLTNAWRLIAPHLERQPGAGVLIMSAGGLGLYAAHVARAYGAGRVRYVDTDESRLELAEELGAEAQAFDDFSFDTQYEVTLNVSDSTTALRRAALCTAPGGHCENGTFFARPVKMPLLAMHLAAIHFRSSQPNTRVHMGDVLELVAGGRLDSRAVHSGTHPFESAPSVLAGGALKPVFTQD